MADITMGRTMKDYTQTSKVALHVGKNVIPHQLGFRPTQVSFLADDLKRQRSHSVVTGPDWWTEKDIRLDSGEDISGTLHIAGVEP